MVENWAITEIAKTRNAINNAKLNNSKSLYEIETYETYIHSLKLHIVQENVNIQTPLEKSQNKLKEKKNNGTTRQTKH